ncbi:hypothetical protein TNCV_2626101 [Trichonephila clavipes]|uniref:Uncharacterized protein n=1 Tax=Trichonephila clavipes TaxID=2585209 RepID=A0A8X6W770_TRICX|nr:hypothetical protein TNCV_2626101 [Trichonephila clavipes]
MSIQRDKPSNFGEKTEDIPTQRDKPSHLGVIRRRQQVFERYRSRQVALQAEPFVNVTVGPAVFVCREEVGVIHRDIYKSLWALCHPLVCWQWTIQSEQVDHHGETRWHGQKG